MRDFIYPVIISVSVITTFTTPYMIRLSDPFLAFLKRRLPAEWLEKLTPSDVPARHTAEGDNEWKKLLQAYLQRIVFYGVILIAVYIGTKVYLSPLADRMFPSMNETLLKSLKVAVTLLLMAPFLYGLGINSGAISSSAKKILSQKGASVWPIIGLAVTRSFIVVAAVLAVLGTYFKLGAWTILAIILGGIAFVLAARHSVRGLSAFEKQFMENYNQKENLERKSKPVTSTVRRALSDYNVRTETVTVSSDSAFAGRRLKDVPLRSETGANIIKLTRGSRSYTVPDGDFELFPGDRLLAVGTSAQIERLRNMMSSSVYDALAEEDVPDFRIESMVLDNDSFLTGKLLRSTNLRKYKCMVISVLHGDEFITNPEPDYRFEEGDTVWMAGDTEALGWN